MITEIWRRENSSLRQRLSAWLSVTILTTGLVAGIVSFFMAYDDAKEFQDHMLRQIAFLETGTKEIPKQSAEQSPKKPKKTLGEYTTRINVIHLPEDPRPDWLTGELKTGFSTLETERGSIRVFVFEGPSGKTTLVAQPTRARDELAVNSALVALIPLLFLLPILVWMTLRIVRTQLAPVSTLANHLDAQPADRPLPLSDQGLPDEIIPFVQSINRLLQRVNDLMKQQRRFIADASHELRTPLTALSLQVENLNHVESLETLRERTLPLQAGIERARKLTEQLLNLARAQSKTPETSEIDVSTMARELIADYLPMAGTKNIDLGLDEAGQLKMPAARELLKRLLRNVLENALKYTPDGGEVTLRLYSDATGYLIEVIDNGPGVPESERERVFDPFYRMSGNTSEGSGLGLSIAREAATHLGGRVSLHDRMEGSGLVVRYHQKRNPC